MAMFQNADEVYKFLGGMFGLALADDEIAARVASSGVVIRFRLSEPDCEFVVDLPGRKVTTGSSGSQLVTSVELKMTADTAHALWLGRVQPAALIATRRVRVRGSVRKLLRMHSLGEQLTPVYVGMLRDAGRPDLVTVEDRADS